MRTRLLRWLLPQWGENPLLDYDWMHPQASQSRRGFAMQTLLILALLGVAGIGYASATGLMAGSLNISALIWQSLYYPVMGLQLLTALAAIALGAGSLSARSQGGTWDHLRVTESGAGLALRASWLSILYRLRAPIAAVLLVRLVLALGMLLDLPAFGSHYVKMLGGAAMNPSSSWHVSLVCLAFGGAAAAMLPLSMSALCAALGIVLSLALREGLFVSVGQSLLGVALVVCVCVMSFAVSQMLQGQLNMPNFVSLPLFISYSAVGDWGLSLMQLGSVGEVWQRMPLGATIGVGLTGLALCLALLADGLMRLAERLTEGRG